MDLAVPADCGDVALGQVLSHGENFWRRNRKLLELSSEVGLRRQRMHQLAEIGLSLSSEMELDQLLSTILGEARRIAGCEGASLYLIEEEAGTQMLVFKLAQNDRLELPFVESRLPLTAGSLAGYVATTGNELNIDDVYELPLDRSYEFNRSFDDQMGYRTQSMLVLPMRDYRGQVVGVLQFINRVIGDTGQPVAFEQEMAELLRAVASQAAVSIQKNTLLRDINQLFESFVQASVKTIEQRDPSTSGHSSRVAETTVALLKALPASGNQRFRNLVLTDEHIKEVRYAALLHDFGKVGVRENVLLKANKLTDERLEIIRYRIALQKERLRGEALKEEMHLLHHRPVDFEVARARIHRNLARAESKLDEFLDFVVTANKPTPLSAGDFSHLQTLRDEAFVELDGTPGGLIEDNDLAALSIKRGSLTPEERREIESHVVHTRDFLSVLPWPPELAAVPAIAAAHHEKLDGTGYPDGLKGDDIPLPSRVMTVCDIYDALTAMDRPYKSAMSTERAIDILYEEAKQGLIDEEIVDVFVASKVHSIKRVI